MKRLTKELEKDCYGNDVYGAVYNGSAMVGLIKANQKLGRLEDLEARIGMPLDIFMKVLLCDVSIWSLKRYGTSLYKISEHTVAGFNGLFYEELYCECGCGCKMDNILFDPKEYGEKWFTSSQEARQKMYKLMEEEMEEEMEEI